MNSSRVIRVLLAPLCIAGLTACSSNGSTAGGTRGKTESKVVTLVAYDSFALPKETLAAFTTNTGLTIRVLTSGDTGEMLNKTIITKDAPLGDVLWAVDSTLLDRAKNAKILMPYKSANFAELDKTLTALVSKNEATPVDYGDVCINYDKAALAKVGVAIPTTFEDLAKPEYKNMLVVENPSTSAPGLAFVLGTIAHFGEKGWESYWEQLRANGVKVVSGWTEAYEGSFTAGGNAGDRLLVVSYASSPPAAVMFGANPAATESPTGVIDATCFRVSEFAAILSGTKNPNGAKALVDFLSSTEVQEELPLNMFVFPANTKAKLPKLFTDFAAQPAKPLVLDPKTVAKNREDWIDAWTKIVL